MARHIDRRTALLTGVAALVLGFGTLALVAQAAELGGIERALRESRTAWLPLCLAGLALSYAGYLVAYRDFARARGGPPLRLPTLARVVLAGFGANAIGSGTAGLAVDYWALRRAGESPHDAGRRVLAFNTMEWAVLGTMAALAGAGTLAGLGDAPAAVALPWVIGVPLCAAAALVVSAPARAERLARPPRPGAGAPSPAARAARAVRAGFAAAVGGLVLMRHVLRHPLRHPGGAFGYLAYWGGQLLVLEAALRAFGEALMPAPLVLAYATAYVASALPLPGGAGGIEASLALLLHLMGVPLAEAVLAVLVHRLVTFWLPILPALATLPGLRRLGAALPEEGRRRAAAPFPSGAAGVPGGLPDPPLEAGMGMDFNPIDVQKALKGADYPSSGEALAATAQGNGASDELVEQLRGLGGGEISGPDQVMKQLAR